MNVTDEIMRLAKWAFDQRGIEPGDACNSCGGWGVSPTSLSLPKPVCKTCWGSGSKSNPWPSHEHNPGSKSYTEADFWNDVKTKKIKLNPNVNPEMSFNEFVSTINAVHDGIVHLIGLYHVECDGMDEMDQERDKYYESVDKHLRRTLRLLQDVNTKNKKTRQLMSNVEFSQDDVLKLAKYFLKEHMYFEDMPDIPSDQGWHCRHCRAVLDAYIHDAKDKLPLFKHSKGCLVLVAQDVATGFDLDEISYIHEDTVELINECNAR